MQSINEIKEILSRCSIDALPAQLKQWEGDSRKGVQNMLTSFRKKYEKHLQEQARLEQGVPGCSHGHEPCAEDVSG